MNSNFVIHFLFSSQVKTNNYLMNTEGANVLILKSLYELTENRNCEEKD